jgi:hypothetical protein
VRTADWLLTPNRIKNLKNDMFLGVPVLGSVLKVRMIFLLISQGCGLPAKNAQLSNDYASI